MESTNVTLVSEDEVNQHLSSGTHASEIQIFICSFCKKVFKTEKDYDEHVEEEHQGILNDDKEALKRTSELTAALNAINQNADILKSPELEEEDNKIQFEMKTSLEIKLDENAEIKGEEPQDEVIKVEEKLKCEECDTHIETKIDLRMHMKNIHEQLFSCNQCLVKIRTKEELKKHKLKIHYTNIKCEKCEFKAKDDTIIKIHMMRKHLKCEMFQCDECSKKFSTRMLLVLHKKKHIPAFNQCDHCEFKGISIKNLKIHKLKNHIPNSFSDIGSKRDHTMVPKSNSIIGNSPPKKVKKIERHKETKIKDSIPKSTKDVIGGEDWSLKRNADNNKPTLEVKETSKNPPTVKEKLPDNSTNISNPVIQRLLREIGKEPNEYILQNVVGDGACGFRCLALHCSHSENDFQRIRKQTNQFIIHHWELLDLGTFYGNFEEPGGITFNVVMSKRTFHSEIQFQCFLDSDEAKLLWMDHQDLQMAANTFKLNLNVLSVELKEPQWTHLKPDPRLKDHTCAVCKVISHEYEFPRDILHFTPKITLKFLSLKTVSCQKT